MKPFNPYEDVDVAGVAGAEASNDPLLDAARDISLGTGARLQQAAIAAPDVTPDRYAQAKRLAEPRGLTADSVLPELDDLQRRADLDKLAADSPGLAEFLATPQVQAVAKDDYANLSLLEKSLFLLQDVPRGLAHGAAGYVGQVEEGLGETVATAERAAIRKFYDFRQGVVETRGLAAQMRFGAAPGQAPKALDYVAPAETRPEVLATIKARENFKPGGGLWWLNPAQTLIEGGQFLQKTLAGALAVPEERQNWVTDLGEGVGQLAGMATQAIAVPESIPASLYALGVQQQSSKAREVGKYGTPEAEQAQMLGGMVSYVTNAWALDKLIERVPPKIKNKVVRWVADKFLAGAYEGAQEAVENTAHNVITQHTTDPNQKLLDGVAGQSAQAFGAAAVVRALLGLPAARGRLAGHGVAEDPGADPGATTGDQGQSNAIDVSRQDLSTAGRMLATVLPSQADAEALGQLQADAKAAKTAGRDPAAVAAFIQSQADRTPNMPSNVYLNAEQVATYFQEQGEDAQARIADMVGDPDALTEARQGTGDLVVPIGKFVTGALRDEVHGDALRDLARLAPDRLSNRELQALSPDELMAQFAVEATPESVGAPSLAPLDVAETAIAELQKLNPQLKNTLRVERLSAQDMANRPSNSIGGKGAVAGHFGAVINLLREGATFNQVGEEIRHLIDTLLGGGQVGKWIDEDAGMQRRVRDFLNARDDLVENARYDDGAEIAQALLDQYFRNPEAVREALPDMFEFLESMDAGKYRPVMEAIAAAEAGHRPPKAASAAEAEVADQVRGQLEATGRYDPGASERMAATLAREYAVRAERRGRGETALDIMQQFPVRLLGETPADLQGRTAPADVALDPYIDDVLARGFDAAPRSTTTGKSLVQAVIDAGGVDPDSVGGGDLRALDAHLRPGLLRKGGLTVEAMAESFGEQDSGFSDLFTTKDEYGRPELNEFLAMLTDELGGGKVTRVTDPTASTFDANRAEVAGAMRSLGQSGVDLEALSRPALRRRIEVELGRELYQTDVDGLPVAQQGQQQAPADPSDAPTFYQKALPDPQTLEEAKARIRELETELRTDSLTGMRNRRAFDEDANLGWASVAVLDLDGLKKVNDLLGHEAGDAMLKGAAEVMLAAEGEGVRFYRQGGDEYAARFQDPARAQALMREIRDRLDSADLVFTVNGERFIYEGIGAGYGIGQDFNEADQAQNADKQARHAAGLREARSDDGPPRRLRRAADGETGRQGVGGGAQPQGVGETFNQSGDEVRGSIQFTSAESLIRLTEKANLSTVHHEFGHLFLNGLMEDAFLDGADPKLAADMDAFLAWRGKDVRVADGPSAVREAIERADHEAFADGYETYLFEGKAPSSALDGLFARFRSWMLSLYGAMRAKNVPISDEMRGVYSRLLASDAEIAEAEGTSGMEGLPDGLSSLVSPGRWKQYQDQLQAARDGARARVQAQVLQAQRREAEAWWKQEREGVEAKVIEEAQDDPAQRALALLSRGVLPDGTEATGQFAPLDRAALEAEFGEAFVRERLQPRRVTRVKGGIDPAMAARMLGFRNTAALVEALVNTPDYKTFVSQETDARMRAMHPDPLTDGTLPEKALQAVHGNARLDALDAELALVAELAGVPAPPARVLGAMARRTINGKALRQVRPNDYLVAERAAGRDAQRLLALARPKLAEALMAKRRQVMNAHLYRAALEAKETEGKQATYLKRFLKKAKRARLGKVGGDYLEQIDNLLAQVSLRPASAPEVGRRAALLQFVKAAEARGETVTVPAPLLALAETTNIRDLSVDALRGIADTVRQIDHLAKTKETLLLGKERRDAAEVDEAMAGSVRESHAEVPDRTGDPTGLERWKSGLVAVDLIRLQPGNFTRDLDGKRDLGAVTMNTVQVIRDAVYGRMKPRLKAMREAVAGFYARHYTPEELRKLDTPVYRAAVGDSWSKSRILSLALNWGNEGNRDRILNADRGRLTQQQVDGLLATLDRRDWQFVQDMAAQVNSYWPDIRDTLRRRTGLAPKKVEPAPFTARTSDGHTLDLPGWYYPIEYDGARSGIKVSKDEADDYFKGVTTSRFIKPQTAAGHNEDRVGGGGRTVRLDLHVAESHMNDVIRDLELGDAVNYVHKALNGRRFVMALNAAGMTEHHFQLEMWLRDVATGELAAEKGMEAVLRAFRGNLSAAVLTFKVSTGLLQLTGLVNTAAEIGPKYVLRGIRRMMTSKWRGPGNVFERIYTDSPMLEDRRGTVTDGVQKVANAKAGPIRARTAAAVRYGWMLIAKNQQLADAIAWLAAEEKGLRDFSGDAEKARRYADEVVIRTQAAHDWIDKPPVVRGNLGKRVRQSEWVKSAVPFMSYMLAKGGLARDKYQQTNFRSPASVLKFSGQMVFLFVLEQMIMDMVRGGLPDDDDDDGSMVDDWGWYIAKETAGGWVGTLPFFSTIATEGRGYTAQSPHERAADIIAKAGDRGAGIFRDKDGDGHWDGVDRTTAKVLVDLLGVTTGAPSSQFNTTMDAVWNEAEGEDVKPWDYLIKPDPNRKKD